MLEIKDMKINWMFGYGNSPDIMILVDKEPKNEKEAYSENLWQVKRLNNTMVLYKDFGNAVKWITRGSKLERDEEGFGGASFDIETTEGNMKFKGAWRGCCSWVNQYFEPAITETAITDNKDFFYGNKYNKNGKMVFGCYIAGYDFKLEYLQEKMKKYAPESELVWVVFPPKDSGIKTVEYKPIEDLISKGLWDKDYKILTKRKNRHYCFYCKGMDLTEYQTKFLEIENREHKGLGIYRTIESLLESQKISPMTKERAKGCPRCTIKLQNNPELNYINI